MSFLRSSSSSAFFFAALDLAVEDFFRDLAVSFEVFVAMRRTVPQLRVDCELSLLSVNHCRYEVS